MGKDKSRYFVLDPNQLERACLDELFRMDHRAILRRRKPTGCRLPALDWELDGKIMDIKSITSPKKQYIKAIWAKNSQLKRYLEAYPDTVDDNSVCLYFHNPTYFDAQSLKEQIEIAPQVMVYKDTGEPVTIAIKHIIVCVRGANNIYEFDF